MAEEKSTVKRKAKSRATDALRRPEVATSLGLSGLVSPYIRTAPDLASIRALYNGTDTKRPLGSFMAPAVIDLLSSYIGMPKYVPGTATDEEAVEQATGALRDNADTVLDLHRAALRDGAAWLFLGYERASGPLHPSGEPGRVTLEALPTDTVAARYDTSTGELTEALITRHVRARDGDFERDVPVIQAITAHRISYSVPREAQPPPSFKLPAPAENPWGFVSLVQFVNEPGAADGGISELERIEPYMQLYHDVLWAAAQGSRMHSTPKLAFSLEDPVDFIRTNFGQAALDRPGGEIRITGTEAFFLGQPDRNKAYYLEADNPIGSAVDLLRLLFYCMITASGTPEYALGVHMSSSFASTKEQAPVWGLKVERKQRQFGACWARAGRMMLAIMSRARAKRLGSYAVKVEWEAPDVRDRTETARQRLETVQAVVAATSQGLMSDRSAVETLRALFPDMKPYEEDGGGEGDDADADAERRLTRKLISEGITASFAGKPDSKEDAP